MYIYVIYIYIYTRGFRVFVQNSFAKNIRLKYTCVGWCVRGFIYNSVNIFAATNGWLVYKQVMVVENRSREKHIKTQATNYSNGFEFDSRVGSTVAETTVKLWNHLNCLKSPKSPSGLMMNYSYCIAKKFVGFW